VPKITGISSVKTVRWECVPSRASVSRPRELIDPELVRTGKSPCVQVLTVLWCHLSKRCRF